jgi:hypothetical protein
MNYYVTHINRRTNKLDSALDDLDGAVDTGTETTRIGEKNLHS